MRRCRGKDTGEVLHLLMLKNNLVTCVQIHCIHRVVPVRIRKEGNQSPYTSSPWYLHMNKYPGKDTGDVLHLRMLKDNNLGADAMNTYPYKSK